MASNILFPFRNPSPGIRRELVGLLYTSFPQVLAISATEPTDTLASFSNYGSWIDLSAPSYGIHGTPNPDAISKTQSHGCVRLTNWDVMKLAGMVRRGTPVEFVDRPQPAR